MHHTKISMTQTGIRPLSSNPGCWQISSNPPKSLGKMFSSLEFSVWPNCQGWNNDLSHNHFLKGGALQKGRCHRTNQTKSTTMGSRRQRGERDLQAGDKGCPGWQLCNRSREQLCRLVQEDGGIQERYYQGKKKKVETTTYIKLWIVLQLGQCLAWISDWCPENKQTKR